jgi:hypothetical protein
VGRFLLIVNDQKSDCQDQHGLNIKCDWIQVASVRTHIRVFAGILIPTTPGIKSLKPQKYASYPQNGTGKDEEFCSYTPNFQTVQKKRGKKARSTYDTPEINASFECVRHL